MMRMTVALILYHVTDDERERKRGKWWGRKRKNEIERREKKEIDENIRQWNRGERCTLLLVTHSFNHPSVLSLLSYFLSSSLLSHVISIETVSFERKFQPFLPIPFFMFSHEDWQWKWKVPSFSITSEWGKKRKRRKEERKRKRERNRRKKGKKKVVQRSNRKRESWFNWTCFHHSLFNIFMRMIFKPMEWNRKWACM